jgi:hypothetical protein
MKKKYFRFMERDNLYGDWIMDILWFRIWRFHFKWFIDCGEWFIYLQWETPERIRGWRLSSAGNMKLNFRRNTTNDKNNNSC